MVVSDYYAIAFLQTQHAVAATPAHAAALALEAGLDVELPSIACYGAALACAVSDGLVAGEFVDRAAARVLRQKCGLGLLDPGWPGAGDNAVGSMAEGNGEVLDLDPPGHRALARRLAEESVVLLANRDAALPLRPQARIAVTGPLADDPLAFYGCYSMPRHLGGRYPEAAEGPPSATVLAALRAELPGAEIDYAPGCAVRDQDRSGFAHAAAHAREADLVVAVLGDEAGLFGRGTSGEGCDVADLRLPGVQEDLVQLYLSDPVAQVVRPARWLAGFVRVPLEPGEARRVTFRLHADRTAFTGRDLTRVVEPGEIGVAVGGASDQLPLLGSFTLCGPVRVAGPGRVLDTPAEITAQ